MGFEYFGKISINSLSDGKIGTDFDSFVYEAKTSGTNQFNCDQMSTIKVIPMPWIKVANLTFDRPSKIGGLKYVLAATLMMGTSLVSTVTPVLAASRPLANADSTNPVTLSATKNSEIPAGVVADIVNRALNTSEIHLHNLGTQVGNSWHQPNASYVSFFGFKTNFDIPEHIFKRGRRHYSYTVNNITSNSMQVIPQGDHFVLTITFPHPSHIKGHCRGPKGMRNCVVGKDKAAPDVKWNNPQVKAYLVPYTKNGGIAFEVTHVEVGGKFDINGIVGNFFSVDGRIKRAVERAVITQVNSANVQDAIAKVTRSGLASLRIPSINSARMRSGVITVSY